MAVTTTAALQSAINTLSGHDAGSPNPVTILKERHDAATYSRWYVTGHPTKVSAPGEIMAERAMWCKTTISGNAAAQAAEILVALEDDSNIDVDAEV